MTTIPSPNPSAVGAPLDGSRSLAVPVLAGWMAVAGLGSLGAGAIHAAAIGVHAEHRPAAITFVIVAALQLAWGALALVRNNGLVALAGIAINLGALAGWIVAKSTGISFIPGLDVAEPIQTADGLAAGLAAASVLLIGWSLWTSRSGSSAPSRPPMLMASMGIIGLSLFGMVAGGTHVHAHGGGAGHAGGDGGGHGHGGGESAAAGHDESHDAPAVVPYDPELPLDFSGVEGVTPRQQARAENIVATTLNLLPQWSDPEYALANGFRSFGDGVTGTEHFINEEFLDDSIIFDPTRPESLVWDTSSGERRLVAAMYMLQRGTPLAEAPNTGGSLMQWHIHNNLCATPSGQFGGLTDGNGECAPGLVPPHNTPMVHVWLEPHPCGPFAALEGIGGGQIAEGEEVLCDHAHGSTG